MSSDRWQDVLSELRQCDYQTEANRVKGILDSALSAADAGSGDGTPSSVLQQLSQARALYDSDRWASWQIVERVLADVEDAQALLMLMGGAPAADSYDTAMPPAAADPAAAAAAIAADRYSPTPHYGSFAGMQNHRNAGSGSTAKALSGSRAAIAGAAAAAAAAAGMGKGSSADGPAASSKARSWLSMLQEFLQAGGLGRAAARQRLSDITEAAEGDHAAASASVPVLLTELLAEDLAPAELLEALRQLLSKIVRPMTTRCNRCGALRLTRRQVTSGTFNCGQSSALYRGRGCGKKDDSPETEWFYTSDMKLQRWNVDLGWFARHGLDDILQGSRRSSKRGRSNGHWSSAEGDESSEDDFPIPLHLVPRRPRTSLNRINTLSAAAAAAAPVASPGFTSVGPGFAAVAGARFGDMDPARLAATVDPHMLPVPTGRGLNLNPGSHLDQGGLAGSGRVGSAVNMPSMGMGGFTAAVVPDPAAAAAMPVPAVLSSSSAAGAPPAAASKPNAADQRSKLVVALSELMGKAAAGDRTGIQTLSDIIAAASERPGGQEQLVPLLQEAQQLQLQQQQQKQQEQQQQQEMSGVSPVNTHHQQQLLSAAAAAAQTRPGTSSLAAQLNLNRDTVTGGFLQQQGGVGLPQGLPQGLAAGLAAALANSNLPLVGLQELQAALRESNKPLPEALRSLLASMGVQGALNPSSQNDAAAAVAVAAAALGRSRSTGLKRDASSAGFQEQLQQLPPVLRQRRPPAAAASLLQLLQQQQQRVEGLGLESNQGISTDQAASLTNAMRSSNAAAVIESLGLPFDKDRASIIDHISAMLRQRGLTSEAQVSAFISALPAAMAAHAAAAGKGRGQQQSLAQVLQSLDEATIVRATEAALATALGQPPPPDSVLGLPPGAVGPAVTSGLGTTSPGIVGPSSTPGWTPQLAYAESITLVHSMLDKQPDTANLPPGKRAALASALVSTMSAAAANGVLDENLVQQLLQQAQLAVQSVIQLAEAPIGTVDKSAGPMSNSNSKPETVINGAGLANTPLALAAGPGSSTGTTTAVVAAADLNQLLTPLQKAAVQLLDAVGAKVRVQALPAAAVAGSSCSSGDYQQQQQLFEVLVQLPHGDGQQQMVQQLLPKVQLPNLRIVSELPEPATTAAEAAEAAEAAAAVSGLPPPVTAAFDSQAAAAAAGPATAGPGGATPAVNGGVHQGPSSTGPRLSAGIASGPNAGGDGTYSDGMLNPLKLHSDLVSMLLVLEPGSLRFRSVMTTLDLLESSEVFLKEVQKQEAAAAAASASDGPAARPPLRVQFVTRPRPANMEAAAAAAATAAAAGALPPTTAAAAADQPPNAGLGNAGSSSSQALAQLLQGLGAAPSQATQAGLAALSSQLNLHMSHLKELRHQVEIQARQAASAVASAQHAVAQQAGGIMGSAPAAAGGLGVGGGLGVVCATSQGLTAAAATGAAASGGIGSNSSNKGPAPPAAAAAAAGSTAGPDSQQPLGLSGLVNMLKGAAAAPGGGGQHGLAARLASALAPYSNLPQPTPTAAGGGEGGDAAPASPAADAAQPQQLLQGLSAAVSEAMAATATNSGEVPTNTVDSAQAAGPSTDGFIVDTVIDQPIEPKGATAVAAGPSSSGGVADVDINQPIAPNNQQNSDPPHHQQQRQLQVSVWTQPAAASGSTAAIAAATARQPVTKSNSFRMLQSALASATAQAGKKADDSGPRVPWQATVLAPQADNTAAAAAAGTAPAAANGADTRKGTQGQYVELFHISGDVQAAHAAMLPGQLVVVARQPRSEVMIDVRQNEAYLLTPGPVCTPDHISVLESLAAAKAALIVQLPSYDFVLCPEAHTPMMTAGMPVVIAVLRERKSAPTEPPPAESAAAAAEPAAAEPAAAVAIADGVVAHNDEDPTGGSPAVAIETDNLYDEEELVEVPRAAAPAGVDDEACNCTNAQGVGADTAAAAASVPLPPPPPPPPPLGVAAAAMNGDLVNKCAGAGSDDALAAFTVTGPAAAAAGGNATPFAPAKASA